MLINLLIFQCDQDKEGQVTSADQMKVYCQDRGEFRIWMLGWMLG